MVLYLLHFSWKLMIIYFFYSFYAYNLPYFIKLTLPFIWRKAILKFFSQYFSLDKKKMHIHIFIVHTK